MQKLKILIADDYPIFRIGLRETLSKVSDIEVIGEAKNGQEAIEIAMQLVPQLILMDLTMPVMNGLEAIRIIKKQHSTIKIIALTAQNTQNHVATAIAAGADGYVLKDDSRLNLSTAIDAVMNDQMYLSPSISNTVLGIYQRKAEHASSATSWRRLRIQERDGIKYIV